MVKQPSRRTAAHRHDGRPPWRATVCFFARHMSLWCLVAGCAYWLWLDHRVVAAFEARQWDLPARVYAAPIELYVGRKSRLAEVAGLLRELGYREVAEVTARGQFARSRNGLRVNIRGFPFWDGAEPARPIDVTFRGGKIDSLRNVVSEEGIALARLEPLEIGQLHPREFEDRILVDYGELSPEFIATLVAVEDRRFFAHFGVDIIGILRAAVANLRAGTITQGGSTLTQQLVKNLYLTNSRTWSRKFNEALMAVSLERRYSKEEILETYCNEVFLGQEGNRAIHGFGLAAQYYFSKPMRELSLDEQAMLVGMVKGPTLYNPRGNEARALERRNVVLQSIHELGMISEQQFSAYAHAPLGVTLARVRSGTRFHGFLQLVRRQLVRDYAQADLQTAGLQIFTTLDPAVQRAAEKSLQDVAAGLGGPANPARTQIQGAVVVTDVRTAEVRALVGDRSHTQAGFNRALDARRQIGSLVKPFVYLTAIAQAENYNVRTLLVDRPQEYTQPDGSIWRPRNFDGKAYGMVALEEAFARSLNLATIDLGSRVGVAAVAEQLRKFGYPRDIREYPSLLLGAIEMSPYELTQYYQVIANDGFRVPLRAVRAVVNAEHEPLKRYPIEVERIVAAGPAYLVKYLLTQAVSKGTARGVAAKFPHALPLGGKTGTSDDARDSWYAGFSGEYLALIWLGRDDNAPVDLTGASGALRVWAELMAAIGVSPLDMRPPSDIAWDWVTRDGTARLPADCSDALRVPLSAGSLRAKVAACEAEGDSGILWPSRLH